MLLTISELKSKAVDLATKIDIPSNRIAKFGERPEEDGRHVEVDSNGYHYFYSERGIRRSRVITNDLDELLYLLFEDVILNVIIRTSGEESLALLYREQAERMEMLSPAWAERFRAYQEEQIAKYP